MRMNYKKAHRRPKHLSGVILEETTDLAQLNGKKVLVLLDEQNLSISARKLGYELQYLPLARKLRALAEQVEIHLFSDNDACEPAMERRFAGEGFQVHLKKIRYRTVANGHYRRDTNIDNLFAFWAGNLMTKTNFEVIVLGSGDYGLSGELSRSVQQRCKRLQLQIMTLSLPGSTAQDLNAQKNGYITANLEIGLDVMKPVSRLHQNKKRTAGVPRRARRFGFRSF